MCKFHTAQKLNDTTRTSTLKLCAGVANGTSQAISTLPPIAETTCKFDNSENERRGHLIKAGPEEDETSNLTRTTNVNRSDCPATCSEQIEQAFSFNKTALDSNISAAASFHM